MLALVHEPYQGISRLPRPSEVHGAHISKSDDSDNACARIGRKVTQMYSRAAVLTPPHPSLLAFIAQGAHTWVFAVLSPRAVLAVATLSFWSSVCTVSEAMRCASLTIAMMAVLFSASAGMSARWRAVAPHGLFFACRHGM